MAATKLPPAPAYKLPGVRLFASGDYRGEPYPPARVALISANVHRLYREGLHVPPCQPGHREDDRWKESVDMDDSDLPAAGWVDPETVVAKADPDNPGQIILRGDIVNVPPEMAQKIWNGEYATGSAELWDSFGDDFKRQYGPSLRRFSYLGADVPMVRRLGRLPMPVPMAALKQFSERRGGVWVRSRAVRSGTAVHCHGEVSRMDRQSAYQAALAALPSLPQAFLDSLSDDFLAMLVKALPTPDTDDANDKMDDDSNNLANPGMGVPPGDMQAARQFATKCSETLRRAGKTPQQFVQQFSEIHRKRGRAVAMNILGKK